MNKSVLLCEKGNCVARPGGTAQDSEVGETVIKRIESRRRVGWMLKWSGKSKLRSESEGSHLIFIVATLVPESTLAACSESSKETPEATQAIAERRRC